MNGLHDFESGADRRAVNDAYPSYAWENDGTAIDPPEISDRRMYYGTAKFIVV